jgi:polar amino acid transport system substrate-binding protein
MAPVSYFARRAAALALFVSFAFPAYCQSHLVFSTIVDQRPSAMMAQRVLTQAYKQLDVTVSFEELPNQRARALQESNVLDGVDYRIMDSPVGDLQKVSISVGYEDLVAYSNGKRFKLEGYKSLQPYTIGYLSGAKVFEERLQGMEVDTAPNLESLFRKLDAGRTDIVIDSRSSYCKVSKLGLHNIVMLEPSLERLPAYHWVSKRHKDLIPRLEAVLKKMAQDGTIRKLQEEAWKDYVAQCNTDGVTAR